MFTHRRGFTLVEVAFSIAIIVAAAITILLLIGKAKFQQQINRSQILAAPAAVNLAEAMAHPIEDWRTFDNVQYRSLWNKEDFTRHRFNNAWRSGVSRRTISGHSSNEINGPETFANEMDTSSSHSLPRRFWEIGAAGPAGRYDWERRLLGPEGPLRPLPPAIAARLESAGDTISSIIKDGGQIYYMAPQESIDGEWDNMAGGAGRGDPASWAKILVAFVGDPAQDVLPYHPVTTNQAHWYPFPMRGTGRPHFWLWNSNADRVSINLDADPEPDAQSGLKITPWNPTTLAGMWNDGTATITLDDGDTATTTAPEVTDQLSFGGSGSLFMKELDLSWSENGSNPDGSERWKRGAANVGRDWRTWQYYASLTDFGGGAAPLVSTSDPHNVRPSWTFASHASLSFPSGWSWMDVWRRAIPEFRRLGLYHTERFHYQLSQPEVFRSTQSYPIRRWKPDPPTFVNKDITTYQVVIAPDGTETVVPTTETVSVRVPSNTGSWITITRSSSDVEKRQGVPSPPLGLPEDTRNFGSDVWYEDHWPMMWGRGSQIRVGLPGLERRVRYRTAALKLWASIHGQNNVGGANSSLTAGATATSYEYATMTGTGDPEEINNTTWGTLANPLLQDIPLPANASEIHPAQVLALNYLAHAAMTVTGYKPPFINRRNSTDPNDAIDLQRLSGPDGTLGTTDDIDISDLPYRALTQQELYLYDAQATDGSPIDVHSDWARRTFRPIVNDPDFPDLAQIDSGNSISAGNTSRAWLFLKSGSSTTDLAVLDDLRPKDMPAEIVSFKLPAAAPAGNTITATLADGSTSAEPYRLAMSGTTPLTTRLAIGPVLNPFPPPYADRGVFNWRGERLINPSYSTTATVTKTRSGTNRTVVLPMWPGMPATDIAATTANAAISDTAMARMALRNALRWALAYTAEHPNCQIVPRVLNRPTMMDSPLYSYDLFANGTSPSYLDSTLALNPVSWKGVHSFVPTVPGREVLSLGGRVSNTGKSILESAFNAWTSGGSTQNDLSGGTAGDFNLNHFGGMHFSNAYGYPSALGHTYTGKSTKISRTVQVRLSRRNALMNGHLTASNYANAGQESAGNRLINGTAARPDAMWQLQPFEAAHRGRQMVFWTCDWLQYEDAESAPSAPVDLSQTGLHQRHNKRYTGSLLNMATQGWPEAFVSWANPARDATLLRLPKRQYLSNDLYDVRTVTGNPDEDLHGYAFTNIPYDPSTHGAAKLLWARVGHWGADRNGNGTWDRGPIPRSQRMKAVEIGRFVVYEPVLWSPLR